MKNPKHTRTAILTVYPSGKIALRTYLHSADNRRMLRATSEGYAFRGWPEVAAHCGAGWREECRILVRSAVVTL